MATSNSRTQDDINYWLTATSATAKNPSAWLYAADRLGRAATELRKVVVQDFANLPELFRTLQAPPEDIGPVMFMLLGFELENLAKGLIVAKDPDKTKSNAKKSKPTAIIAGLASHLNAQLLTEAGIVVSPDEEAQIDRLRTFLEWGGRYPTATDTMKMMYARPNMAPASYALADLAVIDGLIERTRNALIETAAVRAAFDDARRQKQLRDERPAVLAVLEALRKEVQDGITLFYDDAESDDLRGQAVCATCQAAFVHSRHRPGAICRCGTLYRNEDTWNAELQRHLPTVVVYPGTTDDRGAD